MDLRAMLRDKKVLAALGVGGAAGLYMLTKKGTGSSSTTTGTGTGTYADSAFLPSAGSAGGGGASSEQIDAFNATMLSINDTLAGLSANQLSGGLANSVTTPTATTPTASYQDLVYKTPSYVTQQLQAAAAKPSTTVIANDTAIALKAGAPLSPAKAGFLLRNL